MLKTYKHDIHDICYVMNASTISKFQVLIFLKLKTYKNSGHHECDGDGSIAGFPGEERHDRGTYQTQSHCL